MSDEIPTFSLLVRLDDVVAPVHIGLKRLILLVEDLVRRPPSAGANGYSVPKIFFHFDPAPGLKPSREELAEYTEERILQWGVSDAVELLKPLLVHARAVCRLYDRGPASVITGDEWNAMVNDWKKSDEQMGRWNLAQRLTELDQKHPNLKMPPLLAEIKGIFAMRNCLLHSHGVLAQSYCNEPGALRIRFRRWAAWVIDPAAGDHEYEEGEIVRHGQSLQVRIVPSERVWRVDERVLLSPQLFMDLCVTIDSFALELMKSLEAYARSQGIPFKPANEGKGPGLDGPV